MTEEVFEADSTVVETQRFETATGVRLHIRNSESGAEVFLDPIELDGLTRAAQEQHDVRPARLKEYRNEFAMVELGRIETSKGPCLMIRSSASGAEVYLDPLELENLTRISHDYFAPLLDPSDLVSEGEPDPDQV